MKKDSRTWLKLVKIIAALVLALLLLTAEGIFMGMFSVDRALTKDSVEEEIADSAIIDELLEEALVQSTVNDAGLYGDIIQQVLKTETMTNFFANYMTGAMRAQLYGEEYEEIANDELMTAFSKGVEEATESGTVNISPMEEEYLKQKMEYEIPVMTQSLNEIAEEYEASQGVTIQRLMAKEDGIQKYIGTGHRIVMALACIVFSIGLIALFWKSRLGFLWCGVVTAIVATCYGLVALLGRYIVMDSVNYPGDAFIVGVVENGFEYIVVAGYIAAAILIGLCILLRGLRKDR
ncbi:MAG: hypothetical protein GX663_00075 [Clostridiales bacterium]|nr:hypothetical protein [Clostridiales bacterium]